MIIIIIIIVIYYVCMYVFNGEWHLCIFIYVCMSYMYSMPMYLISCIVNRLRYVKRCMYWIKACTVLYCTVLYCTVLYCTVLYCTVLYCTVLYCTVLYCTIMPCMLCMKFMFPCMSAAGWYNVFQFSHLGWYNIFAISCIVNIYNVMYGTYEHSMYVYSNSW